MTCSLDKIVLGLGLAALGALAIDGHPTARASQEPVASQNQEKPASKSDIDRLRDRWTCRTGTDDKLVVTWEFSGDAIVMTEDASALGENYGKQVLKGTFSVRETPDPKELDVTLKLAGTDEKVPPIRAIYLLDGDRLKICYGRPGSPRPTRFPEDAKKKERTDGEARKVMDLRRVKDKKSK